MPMSSKNIVGLGSNWPCYPSRGYFWKESTKGWEVLTPGMEPQWPGRAAGSGGKPWKLCDSGEEEEKRRTESGPEFAPLISRWASNKYFGFLSLFHQ